MSKPIRCYKVLRAYDGRLLSAIAARTWMVSMLHRVATILESDHKGGRWMVTVPVLEYRVGVVSRGPKGRPLFAFQDKRSAVRFIQQNDLDATHELCVHEATGRVSSRKLSGSPLGTLAMVDLVIGEKVWPE